MKRMPERTQREDDSSLDMFAETCSAGTRSLRRLDALMEWVRTILLALLTTLLLVSFVIQRNEVVGQSMSPNLQPNDQLWVEKVTKLWNGIGRGSVITLHASDLSVDLNGDFVKRVIGLPGEHVEIRADGVYIDGGKLREDYLPHGLQTKALGSFADVTLKPGQYFVMGDNRERSFDSRSFGPVPENAIIGRVWFRIAPFDRFGFVP